MIHQSEGLSLGLEAEDDLLGVHTPLDDLEGHPPAERSLLLGFVDLAHATRTDFLQNLVGAYLFGDVRHKGCRMERRRELRTTISLGIVIVQKVFDFCTKLVIASAHAVEKPLAFVPALRRGVDEDLSHPFESVSAHRGLPD
jgi:hypothetical protein